MEIYNNLRFLQKVSGALQKFPDKTLSISKPNILKVFLFSTKPGQARADKERLFHRLDKSEFFNIFAQLLFSVGWDHLQIQIFIANREEKLNNKLIKRYKQRDMNSFQWYFRHHQRTINDEDLAEVTNINEGGGVNTYVVDKYLERFECDRVRVISTLAVDISENMTDNTKIYVNPLAIEESLRDYYESFVIPVLVPPGYQKWEQIGYSRNTKDYHYIFMVGDHVTKQIRVLDSANFFYNYTTSEYHSSELYMDLLQVVLESLRLIKGEVWSGVYQLGPICPEDGGECATIGLFLVETVLSGRLLPQIYPPAQRQHFRNQLIEYLSPFVNP